MQTMKATQTMTMIQAVTVLAVLLIQTTCNGFLASFSAAQCRQSRLAVAAELSGKDGGGDNAAHGMMVELDDTNYQQILQGPGPVLIKTYAPWCGPCKLIQPVLEQYAASHAESSMTVCSLNVEELNPNLKLELVMNEVLPKSLPTLILFSGDGNVAVHAGVIDQDGLDKFVEHNTVDDGITASTKKKNTTGRHANARRKTGFVHLTQEADDYMLSPYGIN